MQLLDIIILLIILGFGLFGMWFGLISTVGSLVGTAAGVYISSRIYDIPTMYLVKITGWSGNFPKVVMFILVFLIVNRLVGFLFHIIDKMLYVFTLLPFINGLNRILGFTFGAFEGILVIGIVFFFIDKFPIWPAFMTMAAGSKVVTVCEGISSFLWPLLPAFLKII